MKDPITTTSYLQEAQELLKELKDNPFYSIFIKVEKKLQKELYYSLDHILIEDKRKQQEG